MASYFIAGASRGLGLGLCSALAAKPASEVAIVYAAARTKTDDLLKLVESSSGRVKIISMDVTLEQSVKEAASQVERSLPTKGLDVLINCAGVQPYTPDGIQTMSRDQLESAFATNVVGTHLVTSALIPLLEKGTLKQVINMSSTVGTIGRAADWAVLPFPAYKVSKAALNQLTRQWAFNFADKDFTIVAVSPGWVQTELGGGDVADISVEKSIECLFEIIFNLKKEDNGKFFDISIPGFKDPQRGILYEGGEYPW